MPTETSETHRDRADRLFAQLVLRNIQLVKWSGELNSGDVIGRDEVIREVRLPPPSASYLVETDRLVFRFIQDVALLDADGNDLAGLSATVVVDFHFPDGVPHLLEPEDDEVIRSVLLPDAWGMAYPYVREAVHTMSLHLGLQAIVLGVLDPGEARPQDAHVRGVAEFRSSA